MLGFHMPDPQLANPTPGNLPQSPSSEPPNENPEPSNRAGHGRVLWPSSPGLVATAATAVIIAGNVPAEVVGAHPALHDGAKHLRLVLRRHELRRRVELLVGLLDLGELAVLDLLDLLVDAALDDDADEVRLFRLRDAENPGEGLVLHGQVPPEVDQDDPIGAGQIQSLATAFEARDLGGC